MEDIISACATALFDRSLAVVGRQFGYLCNYRKNVDSLNDQVLRLDAKRADKSHSVTIAQRNAEKIRSQTSNWQKKADKISEDARKFIEQCEEERKRRCVMGLCPNPVSRYRFSRRACKKKVDIEEAITEAEQILKDSDPAVGLGKEIALSTKGLFVFESRKSILEDILEALQDETKNSIGVYGFGGMGKTTLAKQVAARAIEGNMFEDIVFAPVTQRVELKEIQEKIASMLDLKLKDSTEAGYAGLIYERLKEKKVLVVLDDLWKELDLNDVGIPFGTEHAGCKILLTSRYLQILSSMGTEKDFNLGALEEEEAWRLFEEKTGSVLINSDFRKIGKKVAKRCQGLPVLIVTVSASLSKRPKLSAWNDALNQLKKMNHKEIHDIVNSAIESISYNHLEKTLKQLFLLCGLMGGVASVEEVLQYSWGSNMFDGEAATIQEARDRLHTLILELKESCLLLDDVDDDVDERNSIKMHDVVRDVAISIGRKDLNMFSTGEHDAELSIWRKDDVLKSCTAMVLRGCPKLPGIPSYLECPSLELFVVSGFSRDSSPSIPATFFEKTTKLKVLGMSQVSFSGLPPSLWFLKNLQTLRVSDCDRLKDISVVGELNKLQALSFAGSGIEELSSGIGQLSELRSLDLRGCSKLKIIPAGLVKGLTRLEELYVSRHFNKWESRECVNGSEKINANLQELKHLHNLRTLEIAVGDDKLLPEDLRFEKLERYEIIVGNMWDSNHWWKLDDLGVTRKICLQLSATSIDHLQHDFKRLLKSTEYLCLGEVEGAKNVTPAFDVDGFPNLKSLRIENNYDIQYIVDVGDKQCKTTFPCLESLHLDNLVKLQKICNGQLMKESFCNLATMRADDCHGLKSLFSFSMATGLPKLQEIVVLLGDALETIVAEKNMNDDGANINDGVREEIEFAQLRELTLRLLPKLKNFFSDGELLPPQNKSLIPEICTEDEEEELRSSLPFFTKVSFPKLEKLSLIQITTLDYLMTPSVAKSLVGLRSLSLDCEGMKHVVVAEEEGEADLETITFLQLRELFLHNFSSLPTFYSGSGEHMLSNENRENAIQPLFNEKVLFPKLEILVLDNIPGLKYLMTSSVATCLVGELKRLEITDCEEMKHLVVAEEGETKIETIIFPHLSSLCLRDLPNLTSIYSEMGSNENLDNVATQPLLTAKVSFPKLEELSLRGISNMTDIWSQKFQEISCCNLTSLKIRQCESLTHVFPSFVAQPVNKLEYLSIRDCEELETIIGDGNHEEEITKATQQHIDAATFRFPKLTRMRLEGLQEVECFYPREHTIECPSLTNITVDDCGKLNAFDFLSFPQKQGDNLFEKAMSKLENLSLRSIDLMKILTLYGHFPPHIFSSLKELDIVEFHGGSVVFPSEFVSIICNQLQMFRVYNCSFQEIFPYEGEVSHHVSDDELLPQLTRLELKKLPELNYICTHDQYSSLILKVLDRVEAIRVEECPRLTSLVPASVYFRSLKYLAVLDCGGLTNLIRPSTATSLEQLCHLTISGCELMENVIGDDDEELSRDDNEIIFPNLLILELEKLPRLTSFCSSPNYNFNFPDLTNVKVKECLNMQTFCGGITTTPELDKVKYVRNGQVWKGWDGDINTTVQQMFAKMEAKRQTAASESGESQLSGCEESDDSIESNKGTETCEEVAEDGKEGSTCVKAIISDTREKGKGKEPEVSEEIIEHPRKFEEITRHLDTSTHNYTAQEQKVAGFVASSSKLSSHSEFQEFQSLIPSTSSNNKEVEIHGNAAEPTKEPQNLKHVIAEISEQGTFTENAIEPRIATEITEEMVEEGRKQVDICGQHVVISSNTNLEVEAQLHYESSKEVTDESIIEGQVHENAVEKSSKLEVRELAPLLPSTSSTDHFEAATEVPENSAEAEEITKAEKTPDTFEKGRGKEHFKSSNEPPCHFVPSSPNYTSKEQTIAGSMASSEETNPPAETCLSHSTELEVQRSTSTVESEAKDPKKGSEIDEEVLQEVKQADICDKAQEQLDPPIRNALQVTSQQRNPIHVKSAQKVNEELIREAEIGVENFVNKAEICDQEVVEEGQVADAHDKGKGKEYDVAEETVEPRNETSHCLEPEPETSIATSSSHQESFRGLRECFQILEAQPISRVSAEQVRFMEEASEWFCGYVKQAREYLEQNELISELELKIDDMEAQLQVLKEKKRVAEEKKNLASRVAKFV